jgi:translation initiation factor IF-3
MFMASDAGLDLVEVSPNVEPPVCRIMDYGKWLYQQKRKAKQNQKSHHSTTQKELRVGPEIGENDKNVKIKHARKFLEKGSKVQLTMRFRGREMMHVDQGREVMVSVIESLADIAKPDTDPKLIGRRMIVVLTPIKK